MKKKVLVVLLVLLLVGVLAFTAFACNKNDKKPSTGDKNKKPVDTPKDELDVNAGQMITSVLIPGIDGVLKSVTTIDNKAYVSATIYVDVDVPGDNATQVGVELRLKASADKTSSAKTWAQVELYDTVANKTMVGLFAEVNEGKELLYIGQPLTTGSVKWSKLSQAEDAALIMGKDRLVDTVFNAISDLKKGSMGPKFEAGLISGLAGQILTLIQDAFGSLFVPAEGNSLEVAGGLAANLEVSAVTGIIGPLGGMLAEPLKAIKPYMGLIDFGTDIILGEKLSVILGDAKADENKTATPPTITLKVFSDYTKNIAADRKGKKYVESVTLNEFTGFGIDYSKVLVEADKDKGISAQVLKVKFGIKDLALKNTSEAKTAPFSGNPEDLVLKVSVDVALPAEAVSATGAVFAANKAQLDVYVKPAVKLGFYGSDAGIKDGYFKVDFSGLKGYAELTVGDQAAVVVAEYVDEKDFYVDLTPVAGLVKAEGLNLGKYRIPFHPQDMYDGWIEDMAERNVFADAFVAGEGAALGGFGEYTIAMWKTDNPIYVDPEDSKKNETTEAYNKRAAESWEAAAREMAKSYASSMQEGGAYLNVEDNTWVVPQSASDIDAIIGAINKNKKDDDSLDIVPLISDLIGIVTGGLLDDVKAILNNDAILATTNKAYDEYAVSVNFQNLLNNLLANTGLIGGMNQSENKFGLYNPDKANNEEDKLTVAEFLAKNKVFGNLVAVINAILYDSKYDATEAKLYEEGRKAYWAGLEAGAQGTDEAAEAAAKAASDKAHVLAAIAADMGITGEGATGDFKGWSTTGAEVTAKEAKDLLAMVGLDTTNIESDFYAGLKLALGIKFGTSSKSGARAALTLTQGSRVIEIGIGIDFPASFDDNKALADKNATVEGEEDVPVYASTADDDGDALFDNLKDLADSVLPVGFKLKASNNPQPEE